MPTRRPGRPRPACSPLGPLRGFRVGGCFRWRGGTRHPTGRRTPATLGRTCRRCRRLSCRWIRGTGFASHPPVDTQCIFERLGDHVGIALFAQPLGQRRRFMGQHQGAALDRTDGGAGQHHLSGSAALTHLVAHRRPQGADRGRGRFGRARSSRILLRRAGLRRAGLGRAVLGRAGLRRTGLGRAGLGRGGRRWRRGSRPRRRGPCWLFTDRNGHVQPGLDPLDTLQ